MFIDNWASLESGTAMVIGFTSSYAMVVASVRAATAA